MPVVQPAKERIHKSEPQKRWSAGTLVYTSSGLVVLFLWLMWGDFAWSMRERSVGPMASWYLSHLKVPNVLFGLLLSSLPALIGVIVGPIISVKSDRHRSRWGRRIPFLLATTPLAAFGMIGLGLTPVFAAWVHGHFPNQDEITISIVCFGLFWTSYEFASLAAHSVFGGLVNDVVPKPLLGRFYGMFRAVSLIDGMIFNYWIIGHVPAHFTVILVAIGAFYGFAFLWVCLKIKEGEYPPPAAAGPTVQAGMMKWFPGFLKEVRLYCRECFATPYYLSIFILIKVSALAFSPVNTFAIPYARSLGVDMTVYGKYLALTYLISLCLSYFLGWLADFFHPLRVSIVTLAGYSLLALYGSFYATTPTTFLIAWVGHGVMSGCHFTCSASLGQRLFPHSKYAQFASAASVFTVAANMVAAPLMGMLIDQTGGIYRYTFAVGCVLSILALLAGLIVYRQFVKLGGPENYIAPE